MNKKTEPHKKHEQPEEGLIQFAPYVNEYLATGVPSIS
jgi:hypothetical protein